MINNNNKKCELSLSRLLDSVLVHLPFGPSCLSDANIIRCRKKENPDIVEVDLWNVYALSTRSDDVHDWFLLISKSLTVISRPPQIQSQIVLEKNLMSVCLHWQYFHVQQLYPNSVIKHTTKNKHQINNNNKMLAEPAHTTWLSSCPPPLWVILFCLMLISSDPEKTDILEVDYFNVCTLSSCLMMFMVDSCWFPNP